MKKKMINDKTVRALAIGISTVLATAQPMTALAAEVDETPSDNTINETKPAGVCDAAQEEEAKTESLVNDAIDSAKEVKNDAAAVVADEVGKEIADDVKEKAAAVEADSTKGLAGSTTDLEAVDTQLSVAESNKELADSKTSTAKTKEADAQKVAENVNDAMTEAKAEAEKNVAAISDATTIAQANAAYTDLQKTADDAETTFNEKLAEYNTIKGEYDQAVADIEKYEGEYQKALENGEANLAEAEKKLADAKAKAEALEGAAKTAKDAAKASADEALTIANLIAQAEKYAADNKATDYDIEEQLFEAIMVKYYLPLQDMGEFEIEKVQGYIPGAKQDKWHVDNERNYYKVTFADGSVKYYNYKMDQLSNGKSRSDIVIFEKREVEIFGGENDQYVKTVDGKKVVVDLEAGLKNGSIIELDGKYYETGDAAVETFYTNSTVTTTSKEDVTIGETTTTWKFDDKGVLIKEVTADVTTVTYTGATFEGATYDSKAARDEAAAAKKAELEANGKLATITNTESKPVTTYTASGTYIPTFTKTVDVNQEVERKYSSNILDQGVYTEKEAVDEAYSYVAETFAKESHEYYYFNDTITSDLAVTGATKGNWKDDSDFIVTGTVTATYAKVTKEVVDSNSLGDLWQDIKSIFGSKSAKDLLDEASRKVVEAAGGIYIGSEWVDGKWNKATIYYVKAEKVDDISVDSAATAKDSILEAALKQIAGTKATGAYVDAKNVTVNEKVSDPTYSYKINYLTEASNSTQKNVVVSKETYSDATGLTGEIIQNKNYKDYYNTRSESTLLLRERTDEGLKNYLEENSKKAAALNEKYKKLVDDAVKAREDVETAQKEAEELKKAINELKGKKNNFSTIAELNTKLQVAEANKKAAEETLDEIKKLLEQGGEDLDEVIERLTPAPSPAPNNGQRNTPIATPVVAQVAADDFVFVQAPAQVAALAVAQAGGGNQVQAQGNGQVMNLEDAQTPLTDFAEDEKLLDLDDEKTPLSSFEEESTKRMSWWWLLIVAIMGATGYEMYKKHEKKKKALAEAKEAENK